MPESNRYVDEVRLVKSLLIVTSLQKREDLKAVRLIREYVGDLIWDPLSDLLIDPDVWAYAVGIKGYDPKLIFCHPKVLLYAPATSLYYRCLCGLSIKAAQNYVGAVGSLEKETLRAPLTEDKALRMARIYNTFVCSIIKNSTNWTLDNGNRTIIATLGISIDGSMRNKVGAIAEERIRTLILEWCIDHGLVLSPPITKESIHERMPRLITLRSNAGYQVSMRFAPEPDVSFLEEKTLLAVVEIKGGIDPAGALERYGAAKKSFEHAIANSTRCRNFYLAAVYTSELERRIRDDRLVEGHFNIIEILDNPEDRERFFSELFHHTLRLT